MRKYAITDVGSVREINQDQALTITNDSLDTIGIVCDGMGGHRAGEYASLLTSQIFLNEFMKNPEFNSEDDIINWIETTTKIANSEVYDKASQEESFHGMGTTLVVCVVSKNNIVFGNIGDSRAYICKNERLSQITEDQTFVNVLVKSGEISPDQAKTHPNRNVLMSSLGTSKKLSLDIYSLEKKTCTILLCSDGLYNQVEASYITTVLSSKIPIHNKAMSLIQEVKNCGANDNIGIVILEIDKEDIYE